MWSSDDDIVNLEQRDIVMDVCAHLIDSHLFTPSLGSSKLYSCQNTVLHVFHTSWAPRLITESSTDVGRLDAIRPAFTTLTVSTLNLADIRLAL